MGRIVRLTESDLSRIVKKVINEQGELKPNKDDIRILKFSIYKKNGKASIKLRGTLQDFPKCGPGSLNCFTYPSNLTDGLYTKDNFTGDLFFTYENKTYKCKLEKPCQPIGFL